MKQALILHGTDASPDANWFRWLEQVLGKNSYTTWLPQLPESATPNTEVYNNFLRSNGDFITNEQTLLVGHSSGAVAILSFLQNLDDATTVGDVYLVSVFKDSLGWEVLGGLFQEPYNYELIRTKARSITVIHSDDDPYVPQEQARFVAGQLDARLIIIGGQGHFNLEKSSSYTEFPLLAQIIETNNIQVESQKLATFRGLPVQFIETQNVRSDVACDVYSFGDDDSKDLGIIRIAKGASTPKQEIMKGDKTIKGFLQGHADFTFSRLGSADTVYDYTDDSYGNDVFLGVGDVMQWRAIEDTVCYEICYPPFADGRFKEL